MPSLALRSPHPRPLPMGKSFEQRPDIALDDPGELFRRSHHRRLMRILHRHPLTRTKADGLFKDFPGAQPVAHHTTLGRGKQPSPIGTAPQVNEPGEACGAHPGENGPRTR